VKLHILSRRQWVPAGHEEVFAFFESAGNLFRITPAEMRFQIINPLPVTMREGTLIDYVVRVGLLPVRWTTLITKYDAPAEFVDVQLKGPYSYWHHQHEFIARDGGTEIVDTVHYALPFGILGELVHVLFVRRTLDRIFDYRKGAIESILSPGGIRRSQNTGALSKNSLFSARTENP
jgi:ligand-binding SRPBCC domain-containing protein